MSAVLFHYTLGYSVPTAEPSVDKECTFYTYAEDHVQAIEDLFDNVPNVLHGSVLFRLKAPTGARRPCHEQDSSAAG